jgi:hypothetical protein
VALLKVEQTNLPTIQLATDGDVAIGTSVLSVGYPASSDAVTDATLEPTFKDGRISSRRTRENGLLPVYEISAALTGGMSGGPTVNLDGDVIGVNSFSIAGEVQQFNFVTPASLVTEMLTRNGVSNEPGPIDGLYRQALVDFFAGDYTAAVAGFEQVLDRVPSHPQAEEYRARAVAAATPTPEPTEEVTPVPATPTPAATPVEEEDTDEADEAGVPWLLIGGIVGGLTVTGLAGGGVWMFVRRPRRPPEGHQEAPAPLPERVPSEAGWMPPGWDQPAPHEPAIVLPAEPAGAVGSSHDVFVSYSTRDKPAADAIVARLEQDGIRCWMAPRDVIPGEVWGEAIVEAIETSRLMVVILSGEANQSAQVIREVERAVANDVVVIPFRIESIEPTGAMAYYLASEHWLDAMTPPLETHIAQLVKVAKALLESSPTRRAPAGIRR